MPAALRQSRKNNGLKRFRRFGAKPERFGAGAAHRFGRLGGRAELKRFPTENQGGLDAARGRTGHHCRTGDTGSRQRKGSAMLDQHMIIRRRADGSIDIEFYRARARTIQGREWSSRAGALARFLGRCLGGRLRTGPRDVQEGMGEGRHET